MHKTFVLDTNVLLTDFQSVLKFEEHAVVIPMTVIEELDRFKKEMNELGRNARQFSHLMDELRDKGSLLQGIIVNDQGGTVRVAFCSPTTLSLLPADMEHGCPDNQILAVTKELALHNQHTVLISKDINMRIKSDALGLTAETYENGRVEVDNLYSGVLEVETEVDLPPLDYLNPNQFVVIRSTGQELRYDQEQQALVPLLEDLESWGLAPANDEQRYLMDLLLNDDIKLVTVNGKAGCGKAQPLDAMVLTPTGFTTMGSLTAGDTVLTPKGSHSKILEVFPQGLLPIYKVRFSDGTATECCEDHLWNVQSSQDRTNKKTTFSTKPIKELSKSLVVERKGGQLRKNWSIPMVAPTIDFVGQDLKLHPYVMGALLGDGGTSQGVVTFSSADQFIIDKLNYLLLDKNTHLHKRGTGYDYNLVSTSGSKHTGRRLRYTSDAGIVVYPHITEALQMRPNAKVWGIYRAARNGTVYDGGTWEFTDKRYQHSANQVKDAIIAYGLLGKLSYDKSVPVPYLYASAEQRLQLLQGLMDTDGTISKSGHGAVFYTSSPALATDVKFIIESLGGKATINNKQTRYTHKQENKEGKPSFAVHMSLPPSVCPVTLPRKVERYIPRSKYKPTRYIEAIEYVGEKEAQCILIDDPDHLYVTNNFIVTHNTLVSLAASLRKVTDDFVYRKLLVSRPVMPMGKDIGYLPGTIEEKYSPYLQPIKDNIEFLVSGGMAVKPAGKKRGKKSKDDEEKLAGMLENGYAELAAAGILELEPLLYIRGRSIPNVILLVDEAQNLSPHEIKTIVTRAGKGTKLIFTGDIEQIDHPYLDQSSNGLTYLIEKMKGQKITGHITLTQGERSELAEIASQLL